ncbi:MAG: MBL fold metallo-hydrolase [Beijerinckiaceae bacterium]|nr:MBL fold metallo-hydrolase [Beijerinckiaceae bacterium]
MNRRRALSLSLVGLPVAALGAVGLRSQRNPYYEGPENGHFDGLRFHLGPDTRDTSRLDLLRWQFAGGKAEWPQSVPSAHRDAPPARVEGAALRISYVGHASVLIQTHGVNLLIDPVWSERASPVAFAGPKRVNEPGVLMEDLPPLDAVLVSHNHYDHLDVATLSLLARGKAKRFITPLGNEAIMREHDPAIAAEAYDWGARVEVGRGVFVHFEPCYHWSARGVLDRRMALWSAFVIETPSGNIYQVGDTGFADGAHFKRTREKHGGFKFAILPIGAYAPRWIMRDQHVDPAESLQIMQILGAPRAMAHHWGTFQLTDEPMEEPPELLRAALARENIAPDAFAAIRPGQTLDV